MRLRIALLLVVVFALAGIGAATAAPASAASGFAYGYCYLSAGMPTLGPNDWRGYPTVIGQARVSCGYTTTLQFQVCTGGWDYTLTDWNYKCNSYMRTIQGGNVIYPVGDQQPAFIGWEYQSKITAYGYNGLSQSYILYNGGVFLPKP